MPRLSAVERANIVKSLKYAYEYYCFEEDIEDVFSILEGDVLKVAMKRTVDYDRIRKFIEAFFGRDVEIVVVGQGRARKLCKNYKDRVVVFVHNGRIVLGYGVSKNKVLLDDGRIVKIPPQLCREI